MRVALLISVSKYDGSTQDLPGSDHGMSAMESILKHQNNFDQVLTIDSSFNSSNAKNRIREFVSALKGTKITEFLYYFAGNGHLDKLDYYYLLSDYNESKLLQTSLPNSELDLLIKPLKPELFVKIIDATYTGVHYLKESEKIKTAIDKSSGRFDYCYFLFSSHDNTPSDLNKKYTRFMMSLVDSVKAAEGTVVRYKDVIDFVLDYYRTRGWELPYFVIKARYTEVFCQKSDELTKYLSSTTDLSADISEKNEEEILLERIREEAKNYVPLEELPKIPGKLVKMIKSIIDKNEFINSLFTQEIEIIGGYDDLFHHDLVRDSMMDTLRNYYVVEEHRQGRAGKWGYHLTPTIETKSVGFRLKSVSLFPNVDGFMIELSIFFSISRMQCVYNYFRIIDKGLEKKSLEIKDTIYYFDVSPGDDEKIEKKLEDCIEEYQDYMKRVIKTKYLKQATDGNIINQKKGTEILDVGKKSEKKKKKNV
jgi:Caspase domain